jgi:pimeloyl-ACP methyl ester carboxylesterase
VLLLGHSHGGFVVQHFALAHPERVAGIILYDSSAVTGGEFMVVAGEGVASFAQRRAGRPEAEEVLKAWQSIHAMRSDADYTTVLQGLLPGSSRSRATLDFTSLQWGYLSIVGDAPKFQKR